MYVKNPVRGSAFASAGGSTTTCSQGNRERGGGKPTSLRKRSLALALSVAVTLVPLLGGGASSLAATAGWHATWRDQSDYPTMRPGEVRSFWILFKNTGTETWVRGQWGQQVNLALNGDNKEPFRLGMAHRWLWDDRIATTIQQRVAPGETGEFRFTIRAPLAAGTYSLNLRPVVDGLQWLEDEGVFWTIVVRTDLPATESPTVRWVVSRGVTEGQLTEIRAGIAHTHRYLLAMYGADALQTFEAHARVLADGPMRGIHEICCGAILSRYGQPGYRVGKMGYFVDHPDWLLGGTQRAAYRTQVVSHEHVHLWQEAVGCMQGPPSENWEPPSQARKVTPVPLWFIEGDAEWSSLQAMKLAGVMSEADLRQRNFHPGWQSSRSLVEVEALTQAGVRDGSFGYQVPLQAIERLVQMKGVKVILDVCSAIGSGADWNAAFKMVVGLTPEAFYVEFERWRRAGFK